MDETEVIVEAGIEGGSWMLVRTRAANGAPAYFAEGCWSGIGERGGPAPGRSAIVASWEEAMRLFDGQPWFRFVPIDVHAEFRERVWQAYLARTDGADAHLQWHRRRWAERCCVAH